MRLEGEERDMSERQGRGGQRKNIWRALINTTGPVVTNHDKDGADKKEKDPCGWESNGIACSLHSPEKKERMNRRRRRRVTHSCSSISLSLYFMLTTRGAFSSVSRGASRARAASKLWWRPYMFRGGQQTEPREMKNRFGKEKWKRERERSHRKIR